MTDVDRMIDEALAKEERALLASIGAEPAYMTQALALFDGRTGWVNLVLIVTQAVAFLGGVWAAMRFFAATDALEALHWGVPAAVLILGALVLKTALYPVLQTNRLLRELKRLELQVALKGGADGLRPRG